MSADEWRRDLEAAERELKEAKTISKVRAIQIRIKQIKHYLSFFNEGREEAVK
jgi:hypothetical protein